MVNKILPSLLLPLLFLALPTLAAPSHGIAMHGEPKFAPDFAKVDFINPDAPKGGTLRLAVVGTFDSLNPYIIKGTPAWGPFVDYDRYLGKLVYESLMRRSPDEPFTLYGLIAQSADMAPDRSAISFTLDPRAKFQDGTPVTAEDVLFSWKTLKEKGRPNHRLYYGMVAKAEATGPRTVTFTFKPGGNAELPLILGLLPVLPAHYFKDRPFDVSSLDAFPGTGPYKVARIEPGRRVELQRDPGYWGKALPINRGLFNFDKVSIDYYRDVTTAFEAFKAGLYDLRLEREPDKWEELATLAKGKAKGLTLAEIPNGWPAPTRGFVFNTRRPVFADIRVREALTYAFDFEWANSTFFHNSYRRSTSFFDNSELKAQGPATGDELALLKEIDAARPETAAAPVPPPVIPDAGALRQNLRKAAMMLAEAGWHVANNRLVNGKGEPFTFEILIGDPTQERLALHFAQNLRRLGIKVRVRPVDPAAYQARLDDFDFDMILYRWDLSLSPGNELAFYFGNEASDEKGTRNYMGARDPAIDALIEKIVTAPTREGLVTAARDLDRVLLAGHYLIPLYYAPGERLAYRGLMRPRGTPQEGYLLESWWAAP
jgi:ABC-type oligopeptide transport system substrate-binding subunit